MDNEDNARLRRGRMMFLASMLLLSAALLSDPGPTVRRPQSSTDSTDDAKMEVRWRVAAGVAPVLWCCPCRSERGESRSPSWM
jgi:hypothetical protein